MMKYINSILLIIFGMALAQCSEDEPVTYPRPDWSPVAEDFANGVPDWTPAQQSAQSAPGWAIDLTGNDAAPSWSDPDKNVYPSSMTAVLCLTDALNYFAADGDQMAAFIGDECRGVAQVINSNGRKLFFIQVKASSSESGNVEFRYYSSRWGRIYKSPASDVKYVINKIYGTADNPEYPNFEQSGKYPCIAQAYVNIDYNSQPFTYSADDEFSVFVDGECRSVNAAASSNGTYRLTLYGIKAGEELKFKYYSAEQKRIYTCEQSFVMPEAGGVIGSNEAPEKLTFVPDGSMTAYVALTAPITTWADNAADVVAAFAGGQCIGRGELTADNTYKLVMNGTVSDGTDIDVKYYSSRLGYVFTAASLVKFANGTIAGSAANPKKLAFNLTDKHPLKMKAYIRLNGNLAMLASSGDVMAAFVGSECRGIAQVVSNANHESVYELSINGSLTGSEYVKIRFYNTQTKRLYESTTGFNFAEGKEYGALNTPVTMEFAEE